MMRPIPGIIPGIGHAFPCIFSMPFYPIHFNSLLIRSQLKAYPFFLFSRQ